MQNDSVKFVIIENPISWKVYGARDSGEKLIGWFRTCETDKKRAVLQIESNSHVRVIDIEMDFVSPVYQNAIDNGYEIRRYAMDYSSMTIIESEDGNCLGWYQPLASY